MQMFKVNMMQVFPHHPLIGLVKLIGEVIQSWILLIGHKGKSMLQVIDRKKFLTLLSLPRREFDRNNLHAKFKSFLSILYKFLSSKNMGLVLHKNI